MKTWVVNIGNVPLGGGYPVRLQSMTTTNTLNTRETVQQCIEIIRAGADYVRITARSIKEAENLKNIQSHLERAGYKVPLIADVHFNPEIAVAAARIVEKVRINPGNFVDKKTGKVYTEKEYKEELLAIRKKFIPLIKTCKEHQTALRIGSNHGSLSERILNRWGNTPEGMVQAALEYLEICMEQDFNQVVVSMKASDPKTMVYASRLLAARMAEKDIFSPQHLGVTEAGEGRGGRIKSAIGTGTLLSEGIGDTVRVSLTEAPENEIPAAKAIVEYFAVDRQKREIPPVQTFQYKKRQTYTIEKTGEEMPAVVIGKNHKTGGAAVQPDYILLENENIQPVAAGKKYLIPHRLRKKADSIYPLYDDIQKYRTAKNRSAIMNFVRIQTGTPVEELTALQNDRHLVYLLSCNDSIQQVKNFFNTLQENDIQQPVMLEFFSDKNDADVSLTLAGKAGSIFIDGFGDGILIHPCLTMEKPGDSISLAFEILQAAGVRISQTEYISCPGCGRTLYDLQTTVKKIKEKTRHLKGLKIAVMGCIVNGPGEMGDADFGYVGSGKGTITLYFRSKPVKYHIPEEHAVEELVALIKAKGLWREAE